MTVGCHSSSLPSSSSTSSSGSMRTTGPRLRGSDHPFKRYRRKRCTTTMRTAAGPAGANMSDSSCQTNDDESALAAPQVGCRYSSLFRTLSRVLILALLGLALHSTTIDMSSLELFLPSLSMPAFFAFRTVSPAFKNTHAHAHFLMANHLFLPPYLTSASDVTAANASLPRTGHQHQWYRRQCKLALFWRQCTC